MVDRTHGETKLWESFIKGETAAFEEVYRRYYSLLYSYGIRMVGDRESWLPIPYRICSSS